MTAATNTPASPPAVPKGFGMMPIGAAKCHPLPEPPDAATAMADIEEAMRREFIISPPYCFESAPSSSSRRPSDLQRSTSGGASKGGGALRLLGNLTPGKDLTSFRLPPGFNMSKSQLQLFGESVCCCSEDTLGACAAASTPLERMVAVLRWHLSTTRPAPFCKAPYNPIQGETNHVSSGSLHVLLEQVSHHPPVSAMYATDEERNLRLMWWHKPVPRFVGNGVEVAINGRRLLHLDAHGETFELTSPNLSFRFLPTPVTQWVGTTTIKCEQSGLEAVLEFKARGVFGFADAANRVEGHIFSSKTGKKLLTFKGHWDKTVTFKNVESKEEHCVVDCRRAITDVPPFFIQRPKEVAGTDSIVVWSPLTRAILDEAWDDARAAKSSVENVQRQLRKENEANGVKWSPKYFYLGEDGNWEWQEQGKVVPEAPICVSDNV